MNFIFSNATKMLSFNQEKNDSPFVAVCKKCIMPKPARTHHCGICNRWVNVVFLLCVSFIDERFVFGVLCISLSLSLIGKNVCLFFVLLTKLKLRVGWKACGAVKLHFKLPKS